MKHPRDAPYQPRTQGKLPYCALRANRCKAAERWYQALKNRILLENHFPPGDLEARVEAFVDHCNHLRDHESLSNVTSTDAYFGRHKDILTQRERIKRKTLEQRPLHHSQRAG